MKVLSIDFLCPTFFDLYCKRWTTFFSSDSIMYEKEKQDKQKRSQFDKWSN